MRDREAHTDLYDEEWAADLAEDHEDERRAALEEHDCDGMSRHEFEAREAEEGW